MNKADAAALAIASSEAERWAELLDRIPDTNKNTTLHPPKGNAMTVAEASQKIETNLEHAGIFLDAAGAARAQGWKQKAEELEYMAYELTGEIA